MASWKASVQAAVKGVNSVDNNLIIQCTPALTSVVCELREGLSAGSVRICKVDV